MTEDQAITLVGLLVAGTTGWNDEAVEVYVAELRTWEDPDAGLATVQRIVRGWEEARRPPIGVLLSTYHVERERSLQNKAQIEHRRPAKLVPPSEGYKIMRAAFREERERRGKDPDNPPMESMLLRFGGQMTIRSAFRRRD